MRGKIRAVGKISRVLFHFIFPLISNQCSHVNRSIRDSTAYYRTELWDAICSSFCYPHMVKKSKVVFKLRMWRPFIMVNVEDKLMEF